MYRAEHRDVFQAESRIDRESTIERKQMSTKTTFKRIALVTVAAMGLSFVAVAPSSAAPSAITLTASSTTGTQLTAGTFDTATAATVTLSFLNGAPAVSDTASVTAFLISAPAGNTVLPTLQLVETSSAIASVTVAGSAEPIGKELGQVAFLTGTAATSFVSAKFRVYMNQPTKVGAYVVKLVPTNLFAGGLAADTTGVTITITVTQNAATDLVATTATSLIFATVADSLTAVDKVITAVKTAQTAIPAAAIIKVTQKNAAGVTTVGESFTATIISGPGILGQGLLTNVMGTASASGRSLSVNAVHAVTVFGDGSSGVSKIQISSKAGVILATEEITFFGDATAGTTTVVNAVIGTAAATGTDALFVVLKDAAGTNVSNVTTMYVTSSAPTVIPGAYTPQAVVYDATDMGYYVDLTGLKAGTANITVGTKASAAATTGIEAAAVSVRVGGGATALDDVKVAFDKTSYLPGELAIITVTPVDVAGLVLAPDTYTVFATGGIVAPVAFAGSASAVITGTTSQDGGVSGAGTGADSVATYKVYMPSYQGTFVFKYTTGTMATPAKSAVARTISVSVGASDGGAAAAAAEEATAAANDATDAALSAAEAAEAATAIAQEAVDAVAELSASVTKLISALRAQITTLTNLVVKIQKKVKA